MPYKESKKRMIRRRKKKICTDGPILQISSDDQSEGICEIHKCLVGKVLSRKKINREAFRGTIEQIWNLVGRVEIEMVGDNIFVFHFASVEDRAMIWARGPWHLDRGLLVLEKPSGPGDISSMKFNRAEF
ncbi:hypothetical protein ACOSQ3_002564 [Xanthoceras sorbifolium]